MNAMVQLPCQVLMLWLCGDVNIYIIFGQVRSFEFRSQPRIARINAELEYQFRLEGTIWMFMETQFCFLTCKLDEQGQSTTSSGFLIQDNFLFCA
jgi:hypothetical protein